ncbi:MAG TPA: hypothetical protein VMZ29_14110 [Candidatus Bathyarchaeia archaeon]|nr:hypothetical protein [Candidatus Bathyarchaeia archaeon]
MNKKQAATAALIILFLAPVLIGAIPGQASEAELLAKWAEDKDNLIPDMLAVFEATVFVDFDAKSGYQSKAFNDVTSILNMPEILSEDTDKLALLPDTEVTDDIENFGIPAFVGDKNYLEPAKNTTDAEYTKLDITANFAVESYHYFLLESLESADTSTATSLKISFASSATATISNSAECYNVTLINSIVAMRQTFWYNLVCETNSTFPYVINIEAQNIDVKGYYVFQFDNNKFVVDSRYDVTYIDIDENQLSKSTNNLVKIGDSYYEEYIAPRITDYHLESNSLADINTTKMLAVHTNLDYRGDMHVVARGWESARDLADDLEITWRQQLNLQPGDRITDYEITKAYYQYQLPLGLVKLIKVELNDLIGETTDYNTLVNNAMKRILPLIGVSNNKDTFEAITKGYSIATFWESLKDGFKSFTSSVASVAKKVIDAPANIISSLGDTAAKVITPIGQTISNVVPFTTNMITDSVGHVTNGIVGVAGAAKDLGVGALRQLKIPLIIIGSVLVVGLIIGLGVYFGVVKPKQMMVGKK